MKWYIASRYRNREMVRRIKDFLKKHNQEFSYDWTAIEKLVPYKQNKEKSREIADKINQAIKESDVFALLSDKEGTDMYIELGMAINNASINKNPRIYIVGQENDRSMMHFHPKITRVNYIYDVYKLEKII